MDLARGHLLAANATSLSRSSACWSFPAVRGKSTPRLAGRCHRWRNYQWPQPARSLARRIFREPSSRTIPLAQTLESRAGPRCCHERRPKSSYRHPLRCIAHVGSGTLGKTRSTTRPLLGQGANGELQMGAVSAVSESRPPRPQPHSSRHWIISRATIANWPWMHCCEMTQGRRY